MNINKTFHLPLIKIIVGVSLCFFVLLCFKFFITKSVFYALIHSKIIADTLKNYVLGAVLLLGYYYSVRLFENRKITELSVNGSMKEIIGGFILGLGSLSFVILILYSLGDYKVINIPNFSFLLAPFSFLVTAAVFEEICFRLILYRILEEWLGTYFALVLICLAFTAPHLFNNSITILSILTILLFSFAISLMYSYTRRLWLPFAFHLGWNFAQPLYGSNLSGEENVGSIIRAKLEGPKLLIGSNFGIEDSILSVILLIILSLVFFRLCQRDGKFLLARNPGASQ
jgi:membrane protease YdiL (CAAX protease family)